MPHCHRYKEDFFINSLVIKLLHCEVNQLDVVPVLGVDLDNTGIDEMLDGLFLHVKVESLDADPVTIPMLHKVLPERLKYVSERTFLVVLIQSTAQIMLWLYKYNIRNIGRSH